MVLNKENEIGLISGRYVKKKKKKRTIFNGDFQYK